MIFVTGSQRWGLLGRGAADGNDFFGQDLEMQRNQLESLLPPDAVWHEEKAILPLGGVSFHDDFTIHGSGANCGTCMRRSLACHMRTNRSRLRSAPARCVALEPMPTEREYWGSDTMQPQAGSASTGDEAVCPVIYGQDAFAKQRSVEAKAAAGVGKL